MVQDEQGKPICGSGDCMLGARPVVDVTIDKGGNIAPGRGVSVSPGHPRNLPVHLRPVDLGGKGCLPVFWIDSDDLGSELAYVPSRKKPNRHGEIEPADVMSFDVFQMALCSTLAHWSPWGGEK